MLPRYECSYILSLTSFSMVTNILPVQLPYTCCFPLYLSCCLCTCQYMNLASCFPMYLLLYGFTYVVSVYKSHSVDLAMLLSDMCLHVDMGMWPSHAACGVYLPFEHIYVIVPGIHISSYLVILGTLNHIIQSHSHIPTLCMYAL